MTRSVSIVVPTLEEDLASMARRLDECVSALKGSFEIVIVDDSTPQRREDERRRLREANLRTPTRVLDGPGTGKGSAIRLGVSRAGGDVVFTMDADLPVPLQHIGEFLRLLEEGADMVIAERPLDREFDSLLRYVLSRGLLVMQRTVVFHSSAFKDTQCGFKAFRGDLARTIARGQLVDGGMYDLEYIADARRMGAKIKAVPVVPNPEVRESRINVWRCLRSDWIDVMKVRLKKVPEGWSAVEPVKG
jgi:glycosyltransferase involved in cell wall biosynthesis